MPQTKSTIEELLLWASGLGTSLHPEVEVYQDATTGMSFRARKDIPPATKLVTCSYGVTLSYLNAVGASGFARHTSAPFPQAFLDALSPEDPHIIGHFFLAQQYLLRERSFWWHYIRLLPQPDKPSRIPVLWPKEDQRYLDGTNAEPAMKKRTSLWKDEWQKGTALLQRFENWEQYSYDLYKWAGSIFGSRSFRPSLTIPDELVPDHADHVRRDKFSVLLPVMDIGNHNGLNNVNWTSDPTSRVFTLSNTGHIRKNDQIFNYYGNKSNSELLVGYGFTLTATSELDRDVVNLKLKPGADALALRQSQHCHVIPMLSEEKFMFAVQKKMGLEDAKGLIDLVICMVANKRERKYLSHHPDHCPEGDPDVFKSPLARAILMTLQILNAKLRLEFGRITASGASRHEPRNENQRTAFEYMNSQLSVLSTVSSQLADAFGAGYSTFCPTPIRPGLGSSNAELLSLENAFEWLHINYLDIYTAVVEMISEDQDESLPLTWSVLAEDWDHTYWVVWIFTIWILWARDGEAFRLRHPSLGSWLLDMNSAYDSDLISPENEVLYADSSEAPTIDLMVYSISKLPHFSTLNEWLEHHEDGSLVGTRTRVRNFASYVAHEETFLASYPFQVNDSKERIDESDGKAEQKVLCITKGREVRSPEPGGSWKACMGRSPGFDERPIVQI